MKKSPKILKSIETFSNSGKGTRQMPFLVFKKMSMVLEKFALPLSDCPSLLGNRFTRFQTSLFKAKA